jgi:hypothetical protein
MRRHGGKFLGRLCFIPVVNFDAFRIRQHLHHGRTDIRERDIATGHGQGGGIHNQVSEPKAHGHLDAEDALKNRLHGLEVEERLIDVRDDEWKRSHVVKFQFLHLC